MKFEFVHCKIQELDSSAFQDFKNLGNVKINWKMSILKSVLDIKNKQKILNFKYPPKTKNKNQRFLKQ